jgi:glycosyltransferase involved in cell wall biosynthesis
LKIAIIGTRGIPANYGGFETFAEECASRLVAGGHYVTVYCRSHYVSKTLKTYRGVRLVVLPTLEWKYTDTVVHSLLSVLHALSQRFDLILVCNAANSIYAWIPRILGIPVVVNVDGIERRRRKWSRIGKTYYHLSEYFSIWFPNAIVTDARVIESYYRDRYGADSIFIPYGTTTEKPPGREVLNRLGVAPGEYFLYVSRLEPENNAHLVVKAFESVRTDKRLVVVGDAPYADDYIKTIRASRDSRILFPGAIYGEGYRQLLGFAYCYIHATEVGGTHPALVEAMGQGNIIIANETPENAEVLGNTGLMYRRNEVGDLVRCMQDVEDNPDKYADLRSAALERARAVYSWDMVIRRYEQLFAHLTGQKSERFPDPARPE